MVKQLKSVDVKKAEEDGGEPEENLTAF